MKSIIARVAEKLGITEAQAQELPQYHKTRREAKIIGTLRLVQGKAMALLNGELIDPDECTPEGYTPATKLLTEGYVRDGVKVEPKNVSSVPVVINGEVVYFDRSGASFVVRDTGGIAREDFDSDAEFLQADIIRAAQADASSEYWSEVRAERQSQQGNQTRKAPAGVTEATADAEAEAEVF